MTVGPLVFNYCTVNSFQLCLMTGSHFAEWKEEGREHRKEFPLGKPVYECKEFLHLISIFIHSSRPSSPLCVSKH